ncbi:MAG: mechanosensitive ion channel, partial [Rikenellaceae bacterium]
KKIVRNILEKREIDVSLRSFILSFISITLTLLLIITIVTILGIDTTSFVALFASAGLAIGMALSGTLQNFAGGVLILFLKPFKVGDFIETQGQVGTVKDIHLFNIILNTPDNKTIVIPNGGISNGIINNYSREERRRVDWTFSIAYGDDYDTARELILSLLKADQRVFWDPQPLVALGSLADSSVNLTVRAWVLTSDYWGVYFDMNEKVYKTFSTNGLNIPFPQLDVHMVK